MVAPRDLVRFQARPRNLDTTWAEDFHFLGLQARHRHPIQPPRPHPVPPFRANTPRSAITACPSVQRDPRIH